MFFNSLNPLSQFVNLYSYGKNIRSRCYCFLQLFLSCCNSFHCCLELCKSCPLCLELYPKINVQKLDTTDEFSYNFTSKQAKREDCQQNCKEQHYGINRLRAGFQTGTAFRTAIG